MIVSFVAKGIQGHRRQMIVSHHLKEEEKPVYFSYFLFTQDELVFIIHASGTEEWGLLEYLVPIPLAFIGFDSSQIISRNEFNNYKPRISCAAGYSRRWSRTGWLCSWRKI